MAYTLETALYELQGAEATLKALYEVAFEAARAGALTEEDRRYLHMHRDNVARMEQTIDEMVRGALRGAAGRLGEPFVEQLLGKIPAPTGWPDAPPATAGLPREQIAQSGGREGAEEGAESGLTGLGAALPAAVIWAGVVIGVVAVVAAAWAVIKVSKVAQEMIEQIIVVRQNTKRYAMQLKENRRRYEQCIRSGKTPETCAGIFPTPEAPQEPTGGRQGSAGWIIALSAIGGLALVAGGVWAYDRYFANRTTGFEAARKKDRPKALTAGEIPSALGSYQLEVE